MTNGLYWMLRLAWRSFRYHRGQRLRKQAAQQEAEEEAKRRQKSQARAEQQRKEHEIRCQEAAEQQRKAAVRRLYVQWQTACDRIFSDPATAKPIPQPPSWRRDDASCQGPRHLRACKHNLNALFTSTDDPQEIRRAQRRWHPNRPAFAELQSAGIQEAMVIATEIVAVLNDLLDRV
ncbi:hypothetical protein LTR12_000126 [Friedmanniomyces endolithicus]|nr:hypothetical protein LTR74_003912 [Friedmanniomyces endolithicus]KAK1825325.1 hypothetical protein LTR12_000126 [Friedmanniomyces endolithicus]